MQLADHARLGGRLPALRLGGFGPRRRCGPGRRCGGRNCRGRRRQCSWCGRRRHIRCWRGLRRLRCNWRRSGRLFRLLACIAGRQTKAPRASGMGLACEQRHRGDQDQLAHGNPRHLVNRSYPIPLGFMDLAREAVRADLDQGGPAGQAIDQAEKLTPHDRTPLLINAENSRPPAFPAFFAG